MIQILKHYLLKDLIQTFPNILKVIYSELKKRDDENYYQYIWRIDCLIREGKYKNWESVLPMVNSELYDDEAQYKGECAYRKPCKNARDFYENNVFSSSNIEELTRIKDEVRKERQKLSDERSALKKISRDSGRIEEDLDNLEKLIRSNGEKLFEPRYTLTVDSDNDMLVCLSDFHLGLNVDNTFGKYNSKIAEDNKVASFTLQWDNNINPDIAFITKVENNLYNNCIFGNF